MQNLEHLGIKPVLRSVRSIKAGDCVPVLFGSTKQYRQASALQRDGNTIRIQTLRFRDLKGKACFRYGENSMVAVYEQKTINQALQKKVLECLPLGGHHKSVKEIFRQVRAALSFSPGLPRLRSLLRTMAEDGMLVEVYRKVKNSVEEPCYRQPIANAQFPLLVSEPVRYRAGWVVEVKVLPPSRVLYAEVQWFDGSRSLVREPNLDPLADHTKANQALQHAIAFMGGRLEADFVRVPREMMKGLISPRNGLNINQLTEVCKLLDSEVVAPRFVMNPDFMHDWLQRNYPGWHEGILPYELLVLPPGVH